jgi:3-oxoacyl-[acyl-carrier-protein] synthase-3
MFINTLKSYFPAEILNNQYFADRIDTTDEWIVSRVGIKERRICREKNPTAFMGVQAVNQIPREQLEGVDCIICAASVTQYQAPATANFIAKELGIDGVPAFDVRAACSSFIYGCAVINGLLATGFKKILLVLSEALTTTADYNDRATSILFGDGAVAALISNQPGGFEIGRAHV